MSTNLLLRHAEIQNLEALRGGQLIASSHAVNIVAPIVCFIILWAGFIWVRVYKYFSCISLIIYNITFA